MPLPRPRVRWPVWRHWPPRTARLRFTAVYTGVFLLSGAALVAITYGLFERATEYTRPQLPKVPRTPAIHGVQIPQTPTLPASLFGQKPTDPGAGYSRPLAAAMGPLDHAQKQLAHIKIPGPSHPFTTSVSQLAQDRRRLTQDQHQLTQDQHQLTQAAHQLGRAVHQLAQAAPAQAAQRASDSHQLLVNSGIALGIVAVLALLVGWLVAGRMLRPIRAITRTARRISSTNLHERLGLEGPPDELKELGDTLDDLFGRLDAAFEAQQHFVANASHELRTPLTADRNLLQVTLDDPDASAETWRCTAHELLASNDEQKQLIEALLDLASSEAGLDHREHTDMADICRVVLSRPGLGTDRLALHVETAIRSAPLDGDPRLVERLVTNLVDNAIGHNVAGGHVHISTGSTDGYAAISVTNTGPVIPPAEIDRLFQPFQRLDPRRTHHRNGHGLGLSIVRAIATTHHATVSARPVPDGGLCVSITFPPPAGSGTRPKVPPRAVGLSRIVDELG